MMRRIAVGTLAAAMVLAVLAGCGGSAASPSAGTSAAPPASTADVTEAPVTEEPSAAPGESTAPPETLTMVAKCAGVGIRVDPATSAKLLVRVAKGAKVRVVESVTGDPYEAGSCGASGDDWVKIDRINGKTVKSLYGVSFGYAAGGFFQ